MKFTALLLLALSASSFADSVKPYGKIQGGSLIVTKADGASTRIGLYNEGEKYQTYTYELFELEAQKVATVEIVNRNGDHGLRIAKKNKQLPVSRAVVQKIAQYETCGVPTNCDFQIIGALVSLPVDAVLSPFIGASNFLHKVLNQDAKCAHKALSFLKDKAQVGQEMEVGQSCAEYLIKRSED